MLLCKNLKGFVASRPPLVIFMICLCAFAIVLLSLAYIIENNETRDPDLSKDWNMFLESFSQLRFCMADSPSMNDISLLSPKLELKSGHMDIQPPPEPEETQSQAKSEVAKVVDTSVLKNHSVILSMTVHPTPEFLVASGNLTHLSGTIMGHQLGLPGIAARLPLNVSFILPHHMNRTHCVDNSTCDPITLHTCVSFEGSENIFPPTQTPEVCEKPAINNSDHHTYIRAYKDYTLIKYYMCHKQTKFMINYKSDPNLTVMLSLHDRSIITLHLMHTSCFLFVMVVTLLFYAVIRGRINDGRYHHVTQQEI